jgi:tRNA pseudouridine38-40 synthase
MDFHARYCAKGKKYRYLIYNSSFPSAIFRNRSYHVSNNLDLDSMKKALPFFKGTHDFSAFKATGSSVKTSVRTIMVGTLVDVGMGRIRAEDIPDIIESRDRKRAGRTAPPQGLYLVEVYY